MNFVHLCRDDNWADLISKEVGSRAVRWQAAGNAGPASRMKRILSNMTKWHYTEGNGAFAACGLPVGFASDQGPSFPEEASLEKVNCKNCLARMRKTRDLDCIGGTAG